MAVGGLVGVGAEVSVAVGRAGVSVGDASVGSLKVGIIAGVAAPDWPGAEQDDSRIAAIHPRYKILEKWYFIGFSPSFFRQCGCF